MTCYIWGGDLRPSEEEMKGTLPALALAEPLREDGLSQLPIFHPGDPILLIPGSEPPTQAFDPFASLPLKDSLPLVPGRAFLLLWKR